MFMWYYIGTFLASFFLTIVYAARWNKRFDIYLTLIFTMIPLVNLGNAMMGLAKVLEEALLAQRIIYIGGCFQIFFIMLNICSLCQIEISKSVKTIALLILSVLYLFVQTIGYYPFFYSRVSFEIIDGHGVLHRTYGPVHAVFVAAVILCFAISVGAIIYSYFKKKQVSRKILILLFLPEFVSFFCYFGQKLFGLNFELMPASYVFAQIMYLMIAQRICLYDVSDTAVDSLIKGGEVGFISVDLQDRYLGSSETAKKIFPELLELTVDHPIQENEQIQKLLLSHLDSFRENEENNLFYYQRSENEPIYAVSIQPLYNENRKKGYQFLIEDDTENQKYITLINSYNSDLEAEVAKKTENLISMHNRLILSMAAMVESRDNSTGGHIKRTSEGVRILVEEMKKHIENHVSETFFQNLIKAAPMHDLGKIAVDDAVLRKPGRFTPEEFEKMKAHAAEGARIVHEILQDTDDEFFRMIAENVAHYHHERWDGSGYPEGLKGEMIPKEARIMAIADVYDALVSKRVYKDAMSFEKANQIIMEGMGTQFDPNLRQYYVSARPALEAYYSSLESK